MESKEPPTANGHLGILKSVRLRLDLSAVVRVDIKNKTSPDSSSCPRSPTSSSRTNQLNLTFADLSYCVRSGLLSRGVCVCVRVSLYSMRYNYNVYIVDCEMAQGYYVCAYLMCYNLIRFESGFVFMRLPIYTVLPTVYTRSRYTTRKFLENIYISRSINRSIIL